MLAELVREGTTLILTTQYLEEADRLADQIVVLDHGRTVANGTPAALKQRIGENRFDVTVATADDLKRASAVVATSIGSEPAVDLDALVLSAPITPGTRLVDIVRTLDDFGVDAVDINRRPVSLDDVFLTLTSLDHPTTTDQSMTQEALA